MVVGALVLLGIAVGVVVVIRHRGAGAGRTATVDQPTEAPAQPETTTEPAALSAPEKLETSEATKAEKPAAPTSIETTVAAEAPADAQPTTDDAEPEDSKAEEPKAEEPKAEEPKAEEPKAEEPATPEQPAQEEPPTDDLRKIEGIGPKMASALQAGGFLTYRQLADADEESLRAAVRAAGMRPVASLPRWPERARALLGEDS